VGDIKTMKDYFHVTAIIVLLVVALIQYKELKFKDTQYISLKKDVYISSKVECWDIIKKYSLQFGIPPEIPAAVQVHETGYLPFHLRCKEVSVTGAIGLQQVMPLHAKQFGIQIYQLYNPDTNIKISVQLLAQSYKKYHKNLDKVFANYNGGSQANLPQNKRCKQTRNYVILCLQTYQNFQNCGK
jgi:soluble lytic murein transglycosylase-like protein